MEWKEVIERLERMKEERQMNYAYDDANALTLAIDLIYAVKKGEIDG